MSREKSLLKNTVILSIGNFFPKLTSFITLPILTSALTKVEYGSYDLILTLTMFVIPIATLQIQSAAFRYLIESRTDSRKCMEIISSVLSVIVVASFFASIIVQFFFQQYFITIRVCIFLFLFIDALYQCLGQIVRGFGQNKLYSFASILLAIINTVGIIGLVLILKKGLIGLFVSIIFSHTVSVVYLLKHARILSYYKFSLVSKTSIKELITYSWPMVVNNLSVWVLNVSDRIVISLLIGIEANAVYAVANKIPSIIAIMQSVMVLAWHENASLVVNENDASEYYTNILAKVFPLMSGCTGLLIAFIPIIFKLLIKGDYTEAYNHIPILVLAMMFSALSSFYGGIYIAHKKTADVGISSMLAAGINLIIDIILVKRIGIWAGTISTLIAFVFLYLFRMIDSRRFQTIRVEYLKQIFQIGILIIMINFSLLQSTQLKICNIVIAFFLFVHYNRELIYIAYRNVLSTYNKGRNK